MFINKINVVKNNFDVNIYNDVFFDIIFDYKYFCFNVILITKIVFNIDIFEYIDIETNNNWFKIFNVKINNFNNFNKKNCDRNFDKIK